MDLQALWLTLELAGATCVALALVGLPLAYWLARTRTRASFLVEAVVALPLVLPPTVLGFYVLQATAPLGFAFTFTGILIGSVLFNLPFAVRPWAAAFAAVDARLLDAAACLGASRSRTFARVALPLAWPGVLAGLVLTFAHAVGEFGVVLMVGGNVPGVTRTLSIAIYDDVQALDHARAAATSLTLLIAAFALLVMVQLLARRRAAW